MLTIAYRDPWVWESKKMRCSDGEMLSPGTRVILTSTSYKDVRVGVLVAPGPVASGVYGVHTIKCDDGYLHRTEGRLNPFEAK